MSTPFETYLAKIQNDLRGGKATEHTYRSSLEQLLESLAPGVDASNDPKHIKAGAPDFIVEQNHVPLGYVETKDVGADLDAVEKSEQLKRYRASLQANVANVLDEQKIVALPRSTTGATRYFAYQYAPRRVSFTASIGF